LSKPIKKATKRNEIASLTSTLANADASIVDINYSIQDKRTGNSHVPSKLTDYDKFLSNIDSTQYVWEYVNKTDERTFAGLLIKVLPNEENNNVTTLGIIIDEDVIRERRPRDPRFFNVKMIGYNRTYTFPHRYLLVTKSRVSFAK
jgi:hypothetical protein